MEAAYVEFLAQRLLRLVAQFADFQAANHIGGRLAGVDDVAFNRLDDAARRIGAIVLNIFNRLFAGPAFVVQAAIDHQADRAVQLQLQATKVTRRIGI